MSESPLVSPRDSGHGPDERVETLAGRALTLVATGKGPKPPDPGFVVQMVAAVTKSGRVDFSALVAALCCQGLRREEIADVYIPAVARHLGTAWVEDGMGFAMVTIGCSRLHAMLRLLGPEWRADSVCASNAPALLVLTGADMQHTLGATLLTGQMRRRGLSVRLVVDAKLSEVAELLEKASYDGVMISAAQGERLENLRQIVNTVRKSSGPALPVVIGGGIMGGFASGPGEILGRTGADHATNVLQEALDFCGVESERRTGAQRIKRA